MGCLESYCLKSPVSVIYCSFIEFNCPKKELTMPDDSSRERNLQAFY